MIHTIVRETLIILIFVFSFLQCSSENASWDQNKISNCKRIVSFAPGITETLFALSFGDRVVGVTRFCNYPPQTAKIPRVGGFVDPNYEMLLRLHPDLAIVLKEQVELKRFLHEKSIRFTDIDNSSINGILNSFIIISEACGDRGRGEQLASEIKKELYTNPSKVVNKTPRILLCVDRENPGSGRIGKVFAAGRKTFYNELISIAGGENVIKDSIFAYPSISEEGIIRLSPDIIFDITVTAQKDDVQEKVKKDWDELNVLPVVNNRNVYVLNKDFLTIPGPRMVNILDEFKTAISKWNTERT